MLLNDKQIIELVKRKEFIQPFIDRQVNQVSVHGHPSSFPNTRKCLSYGLSSYGYDFRLSEKVLKVIKNLPGKTINPKNFLDDNLEILSLQEDAFGKFFILPSHSYSLGVSVEAFKMPPNVTAICLGKSTYARSGVCINMTPIEAGFQGFLVVEIANISDADVRIYANEGIAQLLFLEGFPCLVDYETRKGKYQHQKQEITTARV